MPSSMNVRFFELNIHNLLHPFFAKRSPEVVLALELQSLHFVANNILNWFGVWHNQLSSLLKIIFLQIEQSFSLVVRTNISRKVLINFRLERIWDFVLANDTLPQHIFKLSVNAFVAESMSALQFYAGLDHNCLAYPAHFVILNYNWLYLLLNGC